MQNMNLLFICNQGEDRSKTAAEIYSKDYNTKPTVTKEEHISGEKLMI